MNLSRVPKTPHLYLLVLFCLVTILTYLEVFDASDSTVWKMLFLSGSGGFLSILSDVLGTYVWIFLIALILITSLIGRRRRASERLALALILAIAIAHGIRIAFSGFLPRDAPFALDRNDSPYPSGHAARAFAGAAVMVAFKSYLRWLYPVLAFAAGVSRLLLGVHFLTDVIGGALLGLSAGSIVSSIMLRRPEG